MKKHLFVILILIPAAIFAQKSLPNGYGNLNWSTNISSAKESVKGKIIFTDDKKVIISREGELWYHYGFFYKGPVSSEKNQEDAIEYEEKEEKGEKVDEGKLFYIALNFPMISLRAIFKKYKDKYGDPSSKNIKKNRGAIAWDSDKTIIILWVDSYEGRAYCGRVVYLSKEISKELRDYINSKFNKVELELIDNLAK